MPKDQNPADNNDAKKDFGKGPNAKTPEELKAQEDAAVKAAAAEKLQAKIKAAQSGTSYLAEQKEHHLYHVKLDKPNYSPKDGKKVSKAFIQKFSVQDWNNHNKNGRGLGFTAEILWNPEAYADPDGYAAKIKKAEAEAKK